MVTNITPDTGTLATNTFLTLLDSPYREDKYHWEHQWLSNGGGWLHDHNKFMSTQNHHKRSYSPVLSSPNLYDELSLADAVLGW